jgi:hypothetical protein
LPTIHDVIIGWSMWNWNTTSQEMQSKRNASGWSKLPQIKMLTLWQSHSLECSTGTIQTRCWSKQRCCGDVLRMRSYCCCGRKLSSRNSIRKETKMASAVQFDKNWQELTRIDKNWQENWLGSWQNTIWLYFRTNKLGLNLRPPRCPY